VPRQKSVTSQREQDVPDVVIHRYGNGNMAAQTPTWPPEIGTLLWQWQYKQQHGRYGINDLLYIADTASHEHTCVTERQWITPQAQLNK
jgi:hypothetical protein